MKKKKLLLILAYMLIFSINGFAQNEAPNALRLTFKEGKGEVKEVLFTKAPKVTHKADGTVVLTVGDTSNEYAQADIEKMTFFYDDGANAILNAFDDKDTDSQRGIFTTDGKRLNRIPGNGLYIINGKKVLVK